MTAGWQSGRGRNCRSLAWIPRPCTYKSIHWNNTSRFFTHSLLHLFGTVPAVPYMSQVINTLICDTRFVAILWKKWQQITYNNNTDIIRLTSHRHYSVNDCIKYYVYLGLLYTRKNRENQQLVPGWYRQAWTMLCGQLWTSCQPCCSKLLQLNNAVTTCWQYCS
jgi:hypothetical protein